MPHSLQNFVFEILFAFKYLAISSFLNSFIILHPSSGITISSLIRDCQVFIPILGYNIKPRDYYGKIFGKIKRIKTRKGIVDSGTG